MTDNIPPISMLKFETVSIDANGEVQRDRLQVPHFMDLNHTPLKMIKIPGGTGQVGSPRYEEGRMDHEEIRSVQLPSFFISQHPITQAQWRFVAELPQRHRRLNPDPSKFNGENRPVEQISWHDAIEFCGRITELTGRLYRLPSEAEWEYACRDGTTTPFHFGETITTDLANYCGVDHFGTRRSQRKILYKGSYGQGSLGIDRQETTEVGHFQVANAFGLQDMHGNVWEWCSKSSSPNSDWGNQDQYPLRGGSWASTPNACRSAFRLGASPAPQPFIGFRVVCSK
jgi:formylglycine-generating enzyme required for sulfatase activity